MFRKSADCKSDRRTKNETEKQKEDISVKIATEQDTSGIKVEKRETLGKERRETGRREGQRGFSGSWAHRAVRA